MMVKEGNREREKERIRERCRERDRKEKIEVKKCFKILMKLHFALYPFSALAPLTVTCIKDFPVPKFKILLRLICIFKIS